MIGVLTVRVVPDATLNTGSPDTVMGAPMVMSAVVSRVAGTVAEPIKSRPPVPSAPEDAMLSVAPARTSVSYRS